MILRYQSPFDRALDACLGDDVERCVCQWVAQKIGETRKQGADSAPARMATAFEVLPELIYRNLKGNGTSYYSKVFNALAKMSMHSIGMLDMRYEWHEGDGDALNMPVPIPGREVADALRTGMMYSPVSGERVTDFSSHVHVIYMARTDKDPYQAAEE